MIKKLQKNYNQKTLPKNLTYKPSYDPNAERFERLLSKAFENNTPTGSYHIEMANDDVFLNAAKRLGVFSDAPSEELIQNSEFPFWRALEQNRPEQ